MTTPNCPRCQGTSFEIQEILVDKANFRHNAVNCSDCGAVLTVFERYNINYRLLKIAKKLGINLDD